MNTADYLLQNGLDQDIVFLTKYGQYTYADLRLASARLVGELVDAGVLPGDKVGILGENSIFWVAAYLATLKTRCRCGAIPNCLNAGRDEAQSRIYEL